MKALEKITGVVSSHVHLDDPLLKPKSTASACTCIAKCLICLLHLHRQNLYCVYRPVILPEPLRYAKVSPKNPSKRDHFSDHFSRFLLMNYQTEVFMLGFKLRVLFSCLSIVGKLRISFYEGGTPDY